MSGEVEDSSIDLYWLPLGSGWHGVQCGWNGRLFEVGGRRGWGSTGLAEDLYHSALEVRDEGRQVRHRDGTGVEY